MYRTLKERQEQVEREGGKADKSDWFKTGGYTAVLKVPATKESKLSTLVQEAIDVTSNPTNTKVKVMEKPGVSVKNSLVRSNPFPRPTCGRKDCPWVRRGEDCQEQCFKEGSCYLGRCSRCHKRQVDEGVASEEIVEQTYQGESSRSIVTRSKAHYSDYLLGMKKRMKEDEDESSSWMADHTRSHHNGVVSKDHHDDYDFFLVTTKEKPLERQLEEAVRIRMASSRGMVMMGKTKMKVAKSLLNRKGEHYSPKLIQCGEAPRT